MATYRFAGDTVEEAVYTLRDEGGQVVTDFSWTSGAGWRRLSDRVYVGGQEGVRVEYGGGGAATYHTLVRDHLGSLRADVSESDGGRFRLDLWPYGAKRPGWRVGSSTASLSNGAHVFTGHEREYVGSVADPRRGLDYMHARYYSFEMGRFLSVDPVGGEVGLSQSWNRYAYVEGRPIGYVDPNGQSGTAAIAIGAGGYVASNGAGYAILSTGALGVAVVAGGVIVTHVGSGDGHTTVAQWWGNQIRTAYAKSSNLTRKRDARTRPGPQPRPEQGKQDREKNQRIRVGKEKPPQEASDNDLKEDQPGADSPVPDPEAIPKDPKKALKKAIVDLLVDAISRISGN